MAENIFVEANHRAVWTDAFVELHFGCGPTKVGFRIRIDGVLVDLCGIHLVDVKRPVLTISDDCLGAHWICEIIKRRESLVASLAQEPSEAAQNRLCMKGFLIIVLAVVWIAEGKVAATEVGDASKLVLSSWPVT